MSQVVTMGETMALVKAETPGPLAHTRSLSIGMGGAESNFAIALSRLGVSVTWAGRVGDDSWGSWCFGSYGPKGSTSTASWTPRRPPLMIKERRTAEELKVWYYRSGSAGSRLRPQDVPEEQIR
ncbi:2-dehydro-3-deoxygluconokinase, partial [Arthrobacter sp. Hiyo6]